MKFILPIYVLLMLLSACKKEPNGIPPESPTPFYTIDSIDIFLNKTEMNGISFVNSNFVMEDQHIQPMLDIHGTWITTMPFGFVRTDSDSVEYNHDFQWVGESPEGVADIINLCHKKGLKVMLKPHVWAMGTWIGDIEYDTEEEWTKFEDTYIDYALSFAEVAESTQAEAFCIGVEMKQVVIQRPDFWARLIERVKEVYSGPITYAANWDNYQNVHFWDQLDYIGIDAYFPIAYAQTPTVEECYHGWKEDFEEIKLLSETTGKKVVFTEYGFRNTDYTGEEPWDQEDNDTFNVEAQENAYLATFCRFWGEDWFEGGFFWKWFPKHDEAGGENNNRFTPQNKPVENLIRTVFEETKS